MEENQKITVAGAENLKRVILRNSGEDTELHRITRKVEREMTLDVAVGVLDDLGRLYWEASRLGPMHHTWTHADTLCRKLAEILYPKDT